MLRSFDGNLTAALSPRYTPNDLNSSDVVYTFWG
jgi:hypothetical protein